MIIAIKHIGIEGPGSIEDFFRKEGWDFRILDLSKGDELPDNLQELEGIISLGGPMNVYAEDKYPFLKKEDTFLKRALEQEIPILGICLGAQLLAKACGAGVKKAAQAEIGWQKINFTPEAKHDALFGELQGELTVFQWHEDTFEIPVGGVRLAQSDSCLNQAFRYKANAYGLQFHVEVNAGMIKSWIKQYIKEKNSMTEAGLMITEAKERKEEINQYSSQIYLNFLHIIEARSKSLFG